LYCIAGADTFYIGFLYCDTRQLQEGIYFYPNPASDYIQYEINDSTLQNSTLDLKIYSISGAIVKKEVLKANIGKLNMANLASGVYILELKNQEELKYRKKWVVY
jgi:hypothetical protein